MTATADPFAEFLQPQETPKEEDPFADLLADRIKNSTPASESSTKQIFRWIYQVPSAVAQAVTYPLDILKLGAQGAARGALEGFYEPNEIAEKEKAAQQGIASIEKYFPTQSRAEQLIEEKTGAPLTPQTPGQHLLKNAVMTATLTPGGYAAKGAALVAQPTIQAGLEKAGVPTEVAEPLSMFGVGTAPLAYRGAIGVKNSINNLFPSTRAAKLGEQLLAENIPLAPNPSPTLRSAEEAQAILNAEPPPPQAPQPRLQAPLPEIRPEARTPSGQQRSVRQMQPAEAGNVPRPANPPRSDFEAAEQRIAPQRFRNDAEAGAAITQTLRARDQEAYQRVNQAYDRVRALNRQVDDIQPQLVNWLEGQINELQVIPDRSGPQDRKLRGMLQLRNRLAQYDQEGNLIGYLPISNQALIDQTQAWRQAVDFDFGHGKPLNIFKPLIEETEQAALRSAQRLNPEAATALQEAKDLYRDWTTTFNNDIVLPFRDTSNVKYGSNYRKLLDQDEYNFVRHILEITPEGQALSNQTRRNIFSKDFRKIFENPSKTEMRDIDQALDSYANIASPEEVAAIRQDIMRVRNRGIRGAKHLNKIEQNAAKKLNLSLDQVRAGMRDVQTIRQFREKLPKNVFDQLAKDTIREIATQNNLGAKFTGTDLSKVLNNQHNYEVFSEILGREAVEEIRQAATKIGDAQMKSEKILKFVKLPAALKALKYTGVIP